MGCHPVWVNLSYTRSPFSTSNPIIFRRRAQQSPKLCTEGTYHHIKCNVQWTAGQWYLCIHSVSLLHLKKKKMGMNFEPSWKRYGYAIWAVPFFEACTMECGVTCILCLAAACILNRAEYSKLLSFANWFMLPTYVGENRNGDAWCAQMRNCVITHATREESECRVTLDCLDVELHR